MTRGDDKNGPGGDSVERLERALADETRTSAELRDSLETLRQQVEQMSASFERRLGEARTRSETVEKKFSDQQARLEALGSGREESMRALGDARAELSRLKAERDQLRNQLTRVEGMQTATLTLPDDDSSEEPGIHAALPSIEELMASLGVIEEADHGSTHADGGHLLKRVEANDEESQEMIAPELVFPEEFSKESGARGAAGASGSSTSRVLVFLDADQPIKYPIYKDVMTIGRSETADIQVPGDFVSRVHARLLSSANAVVVEDVSSKNGIRVNSKHTPRHTLRHGDVLAVGRLRFTFIDTAAAEVD